MRLLLLTLLASVHLALGYYVESYWETWVLKDYPEDWCAKLEEVPASPVGSSQGVNYVNIAFGDYSGGFGGTECDQSVIVAGIEAVHAKGGKVKVAYGGQLYSMGIHITDSVGAEAFALSILELKRDFGLDGIDLDVEDGGTSAQLQTEVIKKVREFCGEDFHLTYTIPALSGDVSPWKEAIKSSIEYLDAVNVMAYDYYWSGYEFQMDVDILLSIGVPIEKIVYGIMPGHHDAGNEYTSLDDARDAAEYVKTYGLGGVMTWDINRDTDQRMHFGNGDDNMYQTGKGKAAFLNLLSQTLNS